MEAFDRLPITVEVRVGSRELGLDELVRLAPGSVLTLDRAAGEPIDVLAGNVLLASAEIVVVEERLAVRIARIEAGVAS